VSKKKDVIKGILVSKEKEVIKGISVSKEKDLVSRLEFETVKRQLIKLFIR